MGKILWINPVGTTAFDEAIKEYLEKIKRPETIVNVVSLNRGPMHLEYRYYEALVLPDTLHLIKKAEKEGYDAAIIGCFYDPGLHEAREIVDKMIVTAPAEACLHIAATLGHRFSIIVGRNKWIPQMMDTVIIYGLKDKLASFKSVDLGVYDFHKDENLTIQRLKNAAKEAVEKDGAEVIILGCTIQFGFYKELQEYIGVPVIDSVIAPFKYAEFLIELRNKFGWSHSKKYAFEKPPISEIKQWKLEEQYDVKNLW
jgi:allantoin racemase